MTLDAGIDGTMILLTCIINDIIKFLLKSEISDLRICNLYSDTVSEIQRQVRCNMVNAQKKHTKVNEGFRV